MLPLSLLNAAVGHPMVVELKNGETYNGHLDSCDSWMNLILKQVILTSADASKFYKIKEIYIKGSTIKHLRIPDDVIDHVKHDQRDKTFVRGRGRGRGAPGSGRGAQGGRGRQRSDRGK
jgi:U6 snRNA-associated Sm-like protein LSm4